MKNFLNRYKYFLGILVSLAFLYLAMKDIDFSKLIVYFSAENLDMVLYVFVVNIILRIIIALRWHKMLYKFPSNNFFTTFNYTNIGYFANNILPARLGDIIKSYLLAKKKKYNKTQVFTSAVIERLFDLLGLSVLFIIAILRYDIPDNILNGGLIFIGLLLLVTVIVLLLLKKKESIDFRLESISKYKFVNFFKDKIGSVLLYLQNYLNFKDISYLLLSTALIWFLYVFAGYIIIERLGGYLSWDASMLSLIFLGVSFILPSTPGNVGVHQFACVLAFAILGMDQTEAVAFSFYYQIPVIIISILLGFVSIYYEGFSVKGLNSVSKEAKESGLHEIG
jgi:uncharacterized protein (TIRG00374 family)